MTAIGLVLILVSFVFELWDEANSYDSHWTLVAAMYLTRNIGVGLLAGGLFLFIWKTMP